MALVFANFADSKLQSDSSQPSDGWEKIYSKVGEKQPTIIMYNPHAREEVSSVWELANQANNEHHEKEMLQEIIFHGSARNPGLIDIVHWSFGSFQADGSGPWVQFEKCRRPDWSVEKDPTRKTIVAYGIGRCFSHLHMLNIFGARPSLDGRVLDNVFLDEREYPRLVSLVPAKILQDGDEKIHQEKQNDTKTFKEFCALLSSEDPFIKQIESLDSIEEICKKMEDGLMFNGTTPQAFKAYRNWFDKNHDRTYSWKCDDDQVTKIVNALGDSRQVAEDGELPCHSLTVNEFVQILQLAERGHETAIRNAAMHYAFTTDEPGNWLNAVRYAKQSHLPILSVISTQLKVEAPVANFVVAQDQEAAAREAGDASESEADKKAEECLKCAFECYKKYYEEKFDANSLWRLGVLTLYVEFNRKRGLALLEDAERQGCPSASFELGMIYAKGQFVVRNEKKALEYFRKAATGGNPSAQANQVISGDTKLAEIRGHKDAQYMIDLYSVPSKPE